MAFLDHMNLSTLKRKLKSSHANFTSRHFEIMAGSGLIFFAIYLYVVSRSSCPVSILYSPWHQQKGSIPSPAPKHGVNNSPTNISHLVFGLIAANKVWKSRKPYIESWWCPNVTRGYLFFDYPPLKQFLPWPSTSPPYRISDNTSELEKGHVSPIMVRMVHAVLETYRQGDKGVRWYVIAFDDSILFYENWAYVLAKYDHNKYYYIGNYAETIKSNENFSYDMGFGGGGIALSSALMAAMVKDLEACIRRYNYVISADLITQFCVDDFGVSLTVEKGIHQIDLVGDISGYLSAHPQVPLLSLHHFEAASPIFPNVSRYEATFHLMKAAKYGQSRMLQLTVGYDKPRNWSFTISWGYSVHIYENIFPRTMLKRPLETFSPWVTTPKPPKFMFNTRWRCETPKVFFFESIEKISSREDQQIITTYVRAPSPSWPHCDINGNGSTHNITKIVVISSSRKLEGYERSECMDSSHVDGATTVEIKLRACKDDEIIA